MIAPLVIAATRRGRSDLAVGVGVEFSDDVVMPRDFPSPTDVGRAAKTLPPWRLGADLTDRNSTAVEWRHPATGEDSIWQNRPG